jgi:hypothetical protein
MAGRDAVRHGQYAEKFSGRQHARGGVSGRAPEEAPWKDGDRDGRRPLTVRQQIHGEPVNRPPALAPSPLIAERQPQFIQDPPSSQANAVTDGRHSADAHLVRSAPNADSASWLDEGFAVGK